MDSVSLTLPPPPTLPRTHKHLSLPCLWASRSHSRRQLARAHFRKGKSRNDDSRRQLAGAHFSKGRSRNDDSWRQLASVPLLQARWCTRLCRT